MIFSTSKNCPRLRPELLLSNEHLAELTSAVSKPAPRGSYNPMQFVLRLRQDVRDALNSELLTYEKVEAFSTYLHENIHWWQHVGSHLGFLTSLNYPAVAHAAHRDLRRLLANGEKYKSIIAYDEVLGGRNRPHGNQVVNIILHNWFDTYYAKMFILDNKNINRIAQDKRFFLSMGHCFQILWGTSLSTLAATLDPTLSFLPNPNRWVSEFKRVQQQQTPGFVVDAGFPISPLGTKAIFEGQARFNQLQYLAIALNNQFTYHDFEAIGMLSGIYVEAFNVFLVRTGLGRPTGLNNTVVGLFLLLCDIAINPTDGFPIDALHFETFIFSNDPGMRFVMLCDVVAKDCPGWLSQLVTYSADEYRTMSEALCREIVCFSPLTGSAVVANWAETHEAVQQVLREESAMKFSSHNLSIRLFFAKYVRFQQDKNQYPNVFCWPGRNMTSEVSPDLNQILVKDLFDKHRALFIDESDGEIRPLLFEGYKEANIMETFNAFYEYNVTYDMISKWIHERGAFSYNYDWLTSKGDKQEVQAWIRESFKAQFDIYPEELTVL